MAAPAVDWVGPGTRLGGRECCAKIAVASRRGPAQEFASSDGPAGAVAASGGRELAAMPVLILCCNEMERIPVLIDGYVANCFAAAAWHAINRSALIIGLIAFIVSGRAGPLLAAIEKLWQNAIGCDVGNGVWVRATWCGFFAGRNRQGRAQCSIPEWQPLLQAGVLQD